MILSWLCTTSLEVELQVDELESWTLVLCSACYVEQDGKPQRTVDSCVLAQDISSNIIRRLSISTSHSGNLRLVHFPGRATTKYRGEHRSRLKV